MAGDLRLSLSTSTVSTRPHEQSEVTINADASAGRLGAWTLDVTYDPSAVRVVSCAGIAGSICNTSYAAGVIRITGASAGGLSGAQTLANLSFEGLGHGKAESGLTMKAVTLTDTSGAELGTAP